MGLYEDLCIQNHVPWRVPGCFAAVQVCLPTNPLLVNLGLKWIFPSTKHPCGFTINVDISPEQDAFEKIF